MIAPAAVGGKRWFSRVLGVGLRSWDVTTGAEKVAA